MLSWRDVWRRAEDWIQNKDTGMVAEYDQEETGETTAERPIQWRSEVHWNRRWSEISVGQTRVKRRSGSGDGSKRPRISREE